MLGGREREHDEGVFGAPKESVDVVDNAGAQVAARQGRGNRVAVQSGVGWLLSVVGEGGRDPQEGGAEEDKQKVSSESLLLGVVLSGGAVESV